VCTLKPTTKKTKKSSTFLGKKCTATGKKILASRARTGPDLLRLTSYHSCWSTGGRATRLFHRLRSLVTLQTPLQLTRISCKSSRNVCHQVFLGRPLLLLSPSNSHCIATLAGLFGGSHSICSTNVNVLTLTVFDRSSIPAIFINQSINQSINNAPWYRGTCYSADYAETKRNVLSRVLNVLTDGAAICLHQLIISNVVSP